MQRNQNQNLAPYDPTIERTFQAPRRKLAEHIDPKGVIEIIYEVWNRFKKMLRNCPNYDISRYILVYTFYHRLSDSGKDKLDHLNGDSFLFETTAEYHNLLNNLVANHYEKKSESATSSKAASVIEVDQVMTLIAKIDFLMQSMKNFGIIKCNTPLLYVKNAEKVIFLISAPTILNPFSLELQEVFKEPAKTKGKEVSSEENEKEVEAPLEVKALEQMRGSIKFMKDILFKKRHLGNYKIVALIEECSAIIQNKLSPKLKDPRSFIIFCTIGTHFSGRALCDLGASIDLMPYSIYRTLGLGKAKPTSVTLQSADRSLTYPKRVIEDILVKVDKFIFLANLVVLDMKVDSEISIILGRPFSATGINLIDVQNGELTMRVQDQQITFNVLKAMKFPNESDECFLVNVNYSLTGKEAIIERPLDPLECALLDLTFKTKGVQSLERTAPSKVLKASIDKPLRIETLSILLHYVYLGESDILSIIIPSSLSYVQVKKLLRVLRKHKGAIEWTIADIKGISLSFCIHKILLEDDHKTPMESQRKLNHIMKEVVKKEIFNWLDVGIIYPISDSSVYMDYRKLNKATRKDHFPLPFIDQMLDRLAGKKFYYFLDDYLGYNQIAIAPEDK
ncbi:DNA-directed DNA polymerase [Handroanthus impetiginosus]|uniref:DNA-directed DNA polymerase n=1 Tax=Handroanthus impetiginosus TaxID=429701 RepID=A0A2G9IB70_9LAMI|nr:DNA-directed DNA polymerase [Handroanthus impetiginosus]